MLVYVCAAAVLSGIPPLRFAEAGGVPPKSGAGAAAEPESLPGAVPAASAAHLPTTTAQYRALQAEIAKSRPVVADARRRSDLLRAAADALRRRLVETATRVQELEQQEFNLDADIATLAGEAAKLSTSFLQHRAEVSSLLAILERTQRDMPPVMAIRPDDALAAAHVSMLLGTTLPRIYGQAAELSRQLEALRRTRQELVRRRAEASRTAVTLAAARSDTDQLLAMKARQAEQADAQWGDLAAKLDVASSQAANLEVLFRRVALLRAASGTQNLVVVAARNAQTGEGLQRRALLRPVVGPVIAGDGATQGAPGISFLAAPSSEVVAPADSEVLFAGRYHNTGQVLILQAVGGYDLVLEGLERVDVRAGDQLLAGEPVGRMPRSNTESRLYFELRQNGKGVSPAPWLKAELRKVTKS